MLEEALVYAAAFVIVGLAAVFTWMNMMKERMVQDSLNYREELRSGRMQQAAAGNDWMSQLATFAMTPQGQQLLSAVATKLKTLQENR